MPVGRRVRRADHALPRATPSRAAQRSPMDRVRRGARRSRRCRTRAASARPRGSAGSARRRLAPAGRCGAMLDLLPGPPAGRAAAAGGLSRPRARAARASRCWPAARSRCSTPDINWATLRVLARNGVEMVDPARAGLLRRAAMHAGDAGQARKLARRNLQRLPDRRRRGHHQRRRLRLGHARVRRCCSQASPTRSAAARARRPRRRRQRLPRRARPARRRRRCRARCASPTTTPATSPTPRACASAPRRAAARRSAASSSSSRPSGSCAAARPAPTTSSSPEIAAELGRRKAANLRATGADVVAAGNIGCLTQIRQYLDLPVRHTIQILDER